MRLHGGPEKTGKCARVLICGIMGYSADSPLSVPLITGSAIPSHSSFDL